MRKLGTLTLLLVVSLAGTATASLASGHVNFVLGQKMLDEEDWEPLEDQPEFGAQITVGGKEWPVQIAVDLIASGDDDELLGVDIEGSTVELGFGARKIWGKNKVHPFVGGGIVWVQGEIEAAGVSVDDDGVGYWVDGGVFWRLGKRFNLGFDVRVSRAELTFFGEDGEGGGEHAGILLGWGW